MRDRAQLDMEFTDLLRAYLRSEDEAHLFEAAELGRRLVEQEVGPEELVAVHLQAMQVAMRELPPTRVSGAVLKSYNLLLEAVMAYGLAYRDYLRVERRHAEAARLQAERIAARERELRAIVDGMQDGLLLLDREGRVRLVNPVVVDQLAAPTDLVGRSLARGDLPLLDEHLEELHQQTEGANEGVTEWETERNGRAWHVLLLPITVGDQVSAGTVVLLRDVTRQREVERLKDELVSVVSHELRTPMAVVLGFAELMVERECEPTEMRSYAREIHTHAGRLVGLLNEFLDLRRLESGQVRHHPRPAALPPILREVVGQLALPGTPHRLIVDAPDDLPLAWAEPDRVAQVLTNLVGNALKYSPGGGEVRVGALATEREVVVRVTDQGLGLPPEVLPRLFEKFYRVDTPDRQHITGTGLGLAISRRIVEAHGGRIWAESRGLGEGSTFAFTLPRAGEAALPASPGSAGILGGATRARDQLRILLVDDEPAMGEAVTRLLRPSGHAVVAVGSADAALARLRQERFDVVLSDLTLGAGMDGWALAAEVRRQWPGVRFVLATGWGTEIDRAEARARGAAAVLAKPYGLDELRRVLEEA